MSIVGVIGRKRAGKDFLYEIISKYRNVERLAFADSLKKLCASIYKLDKSFFFNDDKKDEVIPGLNVTPREIVCEVGQLYKKKFGNNFWANILNQQIHSDKHYVVTDVRFPREAEILKEQGAQLIYIDADFRLGELPYNADRSEKAVYETRNQFLNDCIIISNNDCKEKFKLQSIFLLKL